MSAAEVVVDAGCSCDEECAPISVADVDMVRGASEPVYGNGALSEKLKFGSE